MRRHDATLLKVFLCLLGLLALTVAAGAFPPRAWHTPAALTIAVAKAGLIAWFFMELHRQSGRVRFFAAVGLVWLFILFLLTGSDYLTRGWMF